MQLKKVFKIVWHIHILYFGRYHKMNNILIVDRHPNNNIRTITLYYA